MREKVLLCRPGMGEITDTVMAAIVRSGIREGVCVVTALGDPLRLESDTYQRQEVRAIWERIFRWKFQSSSH